MVILPAELADVMDFDGDDEGEGEDGDEGSAEGLGGNDTGTEAGGLLPGAREVRANPQRYQWIPQVSAHEVYDLMVEFAESVQDPVLRKMLSVALNGRGAFRRFKDALLEFPEERQRWFAMKDAFFEEQIREWLESIGIEAVAD